MDQLQRSRHCVGGWNYHMQFTPKYRRDVFERKEVREIVRMAFEDEARKMGVRIEVVEFGPDHVHLFVTGCRKIAADEIVGKLKGYSSWFIRKNYTKLIKRYRLGGSFWTDGYFCESIGRVTSTTVRFYIERQQKKHWMHEVHEAPKDAGRVPKLRQVRLESFAA